MAACIYPKLGFMPSKAERQVFVSRTKGKPGLRPVELLSAWKSILGGSTPMMSIEVTRECPLHCPGCYAYGENHLGGEVNLRSLSDYRGDELVERIVDLVRQYRPVHLSLVGGEPLVRHRELSCLLPILSGMNVYTMVVTSAVIPIPREWMAIRNVGVAVSVDGLPEHHDVRRHPATYDRILKNITGRKIAVHWTITRPMLERPEYLEEYLAFWNARPEVRRMWASLYTPQKGEQTPEMLSAEQRQFVAGELRRLQPNYPKLLMNAGIAQAMQAPPTKPSECIFSTMSTNFSADLRTRVEPCIFGGDPDCSQCGCAISVGLHWLKTVQVAHTFKIGSLVKASMGIGKVAGKLRTGRSHPRWNALPEREDGNLVQIAEQAEEKAS
jgi:MoaA/NifB/PqqE/SkfB family radical SAM enzyme